jgi:uncharacterized protein
MFEKLHQRKAPRYLLGLLFGFCFGFLLQKGGVTRYEIIMRQLLLEDFTVLKIILTAVAVGMVGIYAMKQAGWIELHKKSGSAGTSIPGPLIFGIGFGLLGYCPGTGIGAVGHGALDALVGGVGGMLIGSALYAAVYPNLKKSILNKGSFGDKTLIDILPVRSPWAVVIPVVLLIAALLCWIEAARL